MMAGGRLRIMPAMKRFVWGAVINLLVPGSGLILLGLPWLGIALALWFALGAELAACGWLIAPATIPWVLTLVGALCAGAAWVLGQGLFLTRMRFLRDPELPAELAILRRHATEALARGDHRAACSTLRVALSIDDADLPTRILWARLMTGMGRKRHARRAWRGSARLDTHREHQNEIRQALQRLGATWTRSGSGSPPVSPNRSPRTKTPD